MTMRLFHLRSLALTGALVASACGAAQDTGGPSDAGSATPSEAAGHYARYCATCHGPQAEGRMGPNISGSTTAGIGTWTDAQFLAALRSGQSAEGKSLCSSMPKYSASQLSDTQVAALFAYLKTLRNDTANPGTDCP
jgi:cytochrome c553